MDIEEVNPVIFSMPMRTLYCQNKLFLLENSMTIISTKKAEDKKVFQVRSLSILEGTNEIYTININPKKNTSRICLWTKSDFQLIEAKYIHLLNSDSFTVPLNSVNIDKPINDFKESVLSFVQQFQLVKPRTIDFVKHIRNATEKLKKVIVCASEIEKVTNMHLISSFVTAREQLKENFKKLIEISKIVDTRGEEKTFQLFDQEKKNLYESVKNLVFESNTLKEHSLAPTNILNNSRDKELMIYLKYMKKCLLIEKIDQLWIFGSIREKKSSTLLNRNTSLDLKSFLSKTTERIGNFKYTNYLILIEITKSESSHCSTLQIIDFPIRCWCMVELNGQVNVWVASDKEVIVWDQNRKLISSFSCIGSISMIKTKKIVISLSFFSENITLHFWDIEKRVEFQSKNIRVGNIFYVPHLMYIDENHFALVLSSTVIVHSVFDNCRRVLHRDDVSLSSKEVIHLPPPTNFFKKEEKQEKEITPQAHSFLLPKKITPILKNSLKIQFSSEMLTNNTSTTNPFSKKASSLIPV